MTQDRQSGSEASAAPLPRVEKPPTVRCLGSADADALAARVRRLSEQAWHREDASKENRFFGLEHTRHVVFRFIPGNRDPRRFYSQPGWLVWRQWLLPVMERVTALGYGFAEPVFPKAMLARLGAGRRIDTHVDGDGRAGSHPLVHKVHVPLQTDAKVVATVDGIGVHLAAGFAWEVNNLVPHGAFNGAATDRIHFIFEVFEGAGRRTSEEIHR